MLEQTASQNARPRESSSATQKQKLFIIGAMKAGTTSLYEHLATHPELYASPTKEPRFYLLESPTATQRAEYERLFAERTIEKWAFEASTGYTKYPFRRGVPERIATDAPDARFLYMLRDPIERIYSHYLHSLAHGQETKRFAEAVESNPEYLDTSRYWMQIERYLDVFSRDAMHVVVMEEFSRDTPTELRRVFEFLDIDADFSPPNTTEVFHQTSRRTMYPGGLQRIHFRTQALRRSLAATPLLSTLVAALSVPVRLLRRPVPDKSSIRDARAEQMLRERLQDEETKLEAFLGRSLDCWKTMRAEAT